MKKEVIVNAFPKSGVTWLLHLVCDLLEGQHQDAPDGECRSYDHPVTSDWIIRKTHHPYWDEFIPCVQNKIVILTQRDPRDIAVSAMHYRNAPNINETIGVMVWSKYAGYLNSWLEPVEPLRVKKLIVTRYEHLHSQPYTELKRISSLLETSPTDERIQEAITRQSFANMTRQLGGDRHYMRKGIVGDWRNHFDRKNGEIFNTYFGKFMLRQGYIDNLDWWKEL
ncbi:MAG: sulfotransferase domain-containing protein [Planctomycetaceae bacterium]|nr:sulfotransferase domain-containing protein [Planctomycetaceae bacterium]